MEKHTKAQLFNGDTHKSPTFNVAYTKAQLFHEDTYKSPTFQKSWAFFCIAFKKVGLFFIAFKKVGLFLHCFQKSWALP